MNVILFDFDGVIADAFPFCYRIMNSWDSISEDVYRTKFEGNINDALKKPDENPQAKPFDFFGQYHPELMACRPNEETVKVIKEKVTHTRSSITRIRSSKRFSRWNRRILQKYPLILADISVAGAGEEIRTIV